ncbi:MAG: biotin--[acetyl-CoA-carboxylase] ligase [Flavobacteriaceae bacterium]|nr:biotin--[acetyl-CoA-carboxylase] ligase [Flavobacteriaceae bacterium]
MKIIKLHTIASTNDYLKEYASCNEVGDFTVVSAQDQTKGKGQLGSVWSSNIGENLTFSVFLNTSFLVIQNQFYLNCAISIAVFNVIKKMSVPQLSVKWPNDILSHHKKICGILIENVVKSTGSSYSIIGIGVNVNQTVFDSEFKASSLKNIQGKHFDLDELLILIIVELQVQIKKLRECKFEELHKAYEKDLFRKNKPSTFKNAEGELFSGFIKSVTSSGKLQVLLEDEILQEYRLKEVKLLY